MLNIKRVNLILRALLNAVHDGAKMDHTVGIFYYPKRDNKKSIDIRHEILDICYEGEKFEILDCGSIDHLIAKYSERMAQLSQYRQDIKDYFPEIKLTLLALSNGSNACISSAIDNSMKRIDEGLDLQESGCSLMLPDNCIMENNRPSNFQEMEQILKDDKLNPGCKHCVLINAALDLDIQ